MCIYIYIYMYMYVHMCNHREVDRTWYFQNHSGSLEDSGEKSIFYLLQDNETNMTYLINIYFPGSTFADPWNQERSSMVIDHSLAVYKSSPRFYRLSVSVE